MNMIDSSSAVVIKTRRPRVTEVVLNRPEKRNAFDNVIIGQLIAAFEQISQDNHTRVVVLRSAGEHFSAGADLIWMQRMASNSQQENLDDSRQLARLMSVLNSMPQPVIGLVQGAAFGGAVGLAACCDIVIATEQSTFCLSEVKLGLIPAVISPYLVRAIGERQARRYFLSAEVFDAHQAREFGLVHMLAADNVDLQTRCNNMLTQLAGNGPEAMVAAKELIFAVSQQPLNSEVIDDTARRIADIRTGAEGQEGLSAFLEKRAARWVPQEQY